VIGRRSFVRAVAGALAVGTPLAALAKAAVGTTATLRELFAALPVPRRGDWVRIVLGSGVAYQKQIGLGIEPGADGEIAFIETQIGMPGGSCNPNTQ
jgi:hypothetical protein